nr:hypothetical protein [Bacilli bacterium]
YTKCNIVLEKRTMITKIKINFTIAETEELYADAKRFRFTKKDGTPNMGAFMNTLIVKLVEQRNTNFKKVITSIKNQSIQRSSSLEKQLDALSPDNERYFNSRLGYTKPNLNSPISFRPSSSLLAIYDEVVDRVPKGESFSEYLRSLIVGYLSLSGCYKMPIVLGDQFERIWEAFEYQRCISFVRDDQRVILRPFSISPSDDKETLVIVGLSSEMGDPMKVECLDYLEIFESAFISAEYCDFSAEEADALSSVKPSLEKADSPAKPKPAKSIKASIKVNERGLKALNDRFPMLEVKKGQEGTFQLVGPEDDLFLALLYLGQDAFCLSPHGLQSRLRNAFADSLDAYDSNGLLLDL